MSRMVPTPPATVLLRERWARPRIALNLILIQLALTLPGTLAVILRPDNAAEGFLALGLAAILSIWQAYRLATAGVRVGPDGISTLGFGRQVVPAAGLGSVHWHTRWFTDRTGTAVAVYRLRAVVPTGAIDLTRFPCTGQAREWFSGQLLAAGVAVPTPLDLRRDPAARGRC